MSTAANPSYAEVMGPEPVPLPAVLAGVVLEAWALDMPRQHKAEQVLPMPTTEIIVNLSEPYRVHTPGGAIWETPPVFGTGIRRGVVRFEDPPVLRHVAVRLPAYGPARFGVPPSPSPALVPGALGADLTALASAARPAWSSDVADAAYEVIGVLARHMRPETDAERTVRRAVDALVADPAREIAGIADELGVTHKTLISRFRRVTGVTPSQLSHLVMVDAIVRAVPTTGTMPSWTQLIADSPFVDQSHFIRSFRRLVGISPREYRDALTASRYDAPRFLASQQG